MINTKELYKPFESVDSRKKFSVVVLNDKGKRKIISFGNKGSKDYRSGTATLKERDAYRARASKQKKKDGTFAIDDKNSAAYFSYNYLWG